MEKQQKITREKRKALRKRLDALIGNKKPVLYISGFLSWVQFLMRIISFALIARMVEQLYLQQSVNVWQNIGIILILNVVGYIVSMKSRKYQGVVSQHARNQLKTAFFDVFQKHQGTFDADVSVADVLTVASQGIDSLDTYYSLYKNISLRAFANCATVLAIVALMFPLGGIIFLVSLPFIPVSIMLIQKRSKEIMQRYWAGYMDVGNLLMDDLRGMNTLYAYQADERYETTFVERAETFRKVTMDLLTFQLQSVGYMDAVMYLGVGISGFFAVRAFYAQSLTVFSVVFFVLIAAEFFAPIRELGYCMHLLMMNTKMADRIFSFLDKEIEVSLSESSSMTLPQDIQTLKLKNVSFKYDEVNVLQHVNVSMKQGELFAIAGESGRGKTTLAKLLLGYEPLQEGDLLLNNCSLKDISADERVKRMVYVSPNSYVFNASIYDNLVMGTDMTPSELMKWLDANHILTFIKKLPQGLNTIAGEDGQALSPGQRQQIICVRALLSDKAVYIFDEMTSSIDKQNEQAIMELIQLTARQAIVLFISHKMKQVLEADRVLFMDEKGRYQVDTPHVLMQTNRNFLELAQTQAELEEMLNAN